MQKPALVIMAAGIGSRFGGLKQLAPVGKDNEPIIEFSLYDAISAGFEKVVFIIKEEIDKEFRALIGDKVKGKLNVSYVHQSLDSLPEGFAVPEGRIKPWGTAHAILCAKEMLNEPFAVINADDYYGRDAFRAIYDYLIKQQDDEMYRFSMVGYQVENTLTDHGHVTRGVCNVQGGYLQSIDERFRIEKHGESVEFTEDEGTSWEPIEKGTIVSMNLWGFSVNFLTELEQGFPAFLLSSISNNPLKGEYLLPKVVGDLLQEGKATVRVLTSNDQWYGVTYKKDLAYVANAIQDMQKEGLYPQPLF